MNSSRTKSTNPSHGNGFHGRAFFWLAILSLTLPPAVWAVSPPPDGGYPNYNTAEGDSALLNLTTGSDNTALGFAALANTTTGHSNTAAGALALITNTTGYENTALGVDALYANQTGFHNTAAGVLALQSCVSAFDNTAVGYKALYANVANENTAVGAYALFSNTTGMSNTAIGYGVLVSNTTGCNNTASGYATAAGNTTGSNNTAVGVDALTSNRTGNDNTAIGFLALSSCDSSGNTATGSYTLQALYSGENNTAEGGFSLRAATTGNNNTGIGYEALSSNTTGSGNIALGHAAGSLLTTGSDNIEIGHAGNAGESKTIRIGTKGTHTKTVIAGIRGTTAGGGIAVYVDANGRLGTSTSSASFKSAIKPMDRASEAILDLQPVTFRYKQELDPAGIPQFGLVAEEVAKIAPDLVARDDEGKPYTVRYEAVNAMLLNEFLKEHRKVEEQDRQLAEQAVETEGHFQRMEELETTLEQLRAALGEKRGQMRKVSAVGQPGRIASGRSSPVPTQSANP